jgi:hypothetical protein
MPEVTITIESTLQTDFVTNPMLMQVEDGDFAKANTVGQSSRMEMQDISLSDYDLYKINSVQVTIVACGLLAKASVNCRVSTTESDDSVTNVDDFTVQSVVNAGIQTLNGTVQTTQDGETWTKDRINGLRLLILYQSLIEGASQTLQIDHIKVTINYDSPPPIKIPSGIIKMPSGVLKIR